MFILIILQYGDLRIIYDKVTSVHFAINKYFVKEVIWNHGNVLFFIKVLICLFAYIKINSWLPTLFNGL